MDKDSTPAEFDAERVGTGTAEWAEVTENICRGCANDCLYCYAAHNAARFKQRERSEWGREEMTRRAMITSYPARDGVIMFPTSHDITPFNVEQYIWAARLMLEKNNRLLVVSKPRLECIRRVLHELAPFKEQILLRFTIGSINPLMTTFWEPGASSPQERIECLKLARAFGFSTSVSIEPMLGSVGSAIDVVAAVQGLVTETIWIGKMNKTRLRVCLADEAKKAQAIRSIEGWQSDGEILRLYELMQDHPQIRWKDSIKEVVARNQG